MNSFEFDIKRKIKNYLGNIENPLIFEIGSHQNEDTVQFYDIFSFPMIVCFEPYIENYFIGKEKVRKIYFGMKDNYCPPLMYNFAISNKDGKTSFFRSSNNGLSGSLKTPKLHKLHYPEVEFDNGEFLVDCIRLDTIIKDLGWNTKIIDLSWIDVQGAELEVFEGGKSFFANCRYVYTEFSQIELYENAPNIDQILNAIGDNWSVVEYMWINGNIDGNVLLKNNRFL